jgi:hypothetical protein
MIYVPRIRPRDRFATDDDNDIESLDEDVDTTDARDILLIIMNRHVQARNGFLKAA